MRPLKDRNVVSFKIEMGYLRAMADGDNPDSRTDYGNGEGYIFFVEGRKVREINILWWGPWLDRVRTSLTDLERNI